MTFNLLSNEKDYANIQKIANSFYKASAFHRLLFIAMVVYTALWLPYYTLVLLFLQGFKSFGLRLIADFLMVLVVVLLGRKNKKIKSAKYVNVYENMLTADTVTFGRSGFEIGGVKYRKSSIRAVILHKEYMLFTLKNKKYFMLQLSEEENSQLYSWLKGITAFAYGAAYNQKAYTKRSNKETMRWFLPLAIGALLFVVAANNAKIETPVIDKEPVEKFTFDMSGNISNQFNTLYEYYEATHDVVGTADIYYTYVSHAANLLAKTNYKNGDMQKEKELLFVEDGDFWYVKLFTPENETNLALEIKDSSTTYLLQKTDEGYNVYFSENLSALSHKDAFIQITEIETIADKYPNHKYAFFHSGLGTAIDLKPTKGEKIRCIMGSEEFSFATESKDREFKVRYRNVEQSEIYSFRRMVELAVETQEVPFGTIIKEINKFVIE